ncbi:MAG: MGMT family protein, partial [Rhodoferax sp.]|nr:MGMT family protein [Rhodoferax sp.]
LSIFVPCHRVLGANGALTGYAGGLERKQALLHLEQKDTARRAFTREKPPLNLKRAVDGFTSTGDACTP